MITVVTWVLFDYSIGCRFYYGQMVGYLIQNLIAMFSEDNEQINPTRIRLG